MKNYIEKYAAGILLKLGMAPRSKGYMYALKGVLYIMDTPGEYRYFSRQLYPKLANDFETSAAAVERAIRSAIHTSWYRRNRGLSENIFQNSLQSINDVPTNTLYLFAVSEWLRLNYSSSDSV